MVVDDEPRLVSLVEAYLTQEGFRVVTAGDGRQALFLARQEKPDLIVLDIMMPEMDGYDFMRLHRKEQETPIILLTARVEDDDQGLGRAAAGDSESGGGREPGGPPPPAQPLPPGRAGGAHSGGAAAHGTGTPQRPGSAGRRHHRGSGDSHRAGGGTLRGPDPLRVRPVGDVEVVPGPGLFAFGAAGPDPRSGLRGLRAHNRRACGEPAGGGG